MQNMKTPQKKLTSEEVPQPQEKLSPKEIVSKNLYYAIPIYQRLFEWDEENITELLSDLDNSRREKNPTYYIGILTAKKNPQKKYEYELIDGQQRFVFMMLLGCVLKDYYKDWKEFIGSNENPRLKFSARKDDMKYLKALIDGTEENYAPNLKMEDGIRIIKEFVNKLDKEKKDFAEYAFKNMSFFVSKLPDDYVTEDLNTYFERMNTTGKNLEPHEILKVELLSCLKESSKCMQLWNQLADMDTPLKPLKKDKISIYKFKEWALKNLDWKGILNPKYNKYYFIKDVDDNDKSIEDIIKSVSLDNPIEEPSDDDSISDAIDDDDESYGVLSFPQFLLQTLYWYLNEKRIKKEEFFNKGNLLKTFRDNLPKNKRRDFFYYLVWCRFVLDICFIRRTRRTERTDDERFSLDMNLQKDTNDTKKTKKKELLMFESMLYVSSSGSTNYNWFGWLMDYVNDCVNDGKEIIAEGIYNHLKEKDDESHKEDEVYKFLKDYGSTLNQESTDKILSYRKFSNYWFFRLDFYLWLNMDKYFKGYKKYKKIVDNYVFRRSNNSIDHFHPQNENDQDEGWSDNHIHSFGNLALVSQSFNSEQSNDHVDIKIQRIKKHQIDRNSLQSLKLLKMYIDATADSNGWTEGKASKHEAEMIDVLKKSFSE